MLIHNVRNCCVIVQCVSVTMVTAVINKYDLVEKVLWGAVDDTGDRA